MVGEDTATFCYKCGSKEHNIAQCLSSESLCFNCKKPGHWSKDCPYPRKSASWKCYTCGELGHFSSNCPLRKCFRCDGLGHWSRDCRESWRSGFQFKCYKCGSPDHAVADCTQERRDQSTGSASPRPSPGSSDSSGSSSRSSPEAEWSSAEHSQGRSSRTSSTSSGPSSKDCSDPNPREKGNVAYKSGCYGDAAFFYTIAISLAPNDDVLYSNRAAAYIGMKQFIPALSDCLEAISNQSYPTAKVLIRLSRCHYALGSIVAALSAVRQALLLEPENSIAIALQDRVRKLDKLLKDLDDARSQNRWGAARGIYDACVTTILQEAEELPHEWRCWEVELEIAQANWKVARNIIDRAIQVHFKSSELVALRATVFFLTAELENALQHVDIALRLESNNPRAGALQKRVRRVQQLKEQGNTCFGGGQWNEAIEKYTETLQIIGDNGEEGKGGPMRAVILSNRAAAFVKINRYADALEDITASLLLNLKSSKALRTRAKVHVHDKNYELAIVDLKLALQYAITPAERNAIASDLHQAEMLGGVDSNGNKDWYAVLGVPRGCSDDEIKKAYKRECLKHHPDKGGDEERFKLMGQAYAVLSDPLERRFYDMHL